MGAAFSDATSQIVQDTVNSISSKCSPSSTNVQKVVCKSNINNCKHFTQICNANITTRQDCSMASVEDAAADATTDLDSKAKAGLGAAGSMSRSEVAQHFKNITNHDCSPSNLQSQDIYSELSCINSEDATNSAIANMDALTTCKINAIAKTTSTAYTKAVSDAEAYNPLGFFDKLTQALIYCGIAIVAIIVILGFMRYLRGSGNNPSPNTMPPPPPEVEMTQIGGNYPQLPPPQPEQDFIPPQMRRVASNVRNRWNAVRNVPMQEFP